MIYLVKVGKVLSREEEHEFNKKILNEEKIVSVFRQENISPKSGDLSKGMVFYYAQEGAPSEFKVSETSKLLVVDDHLKVLLSLYTNVNSNEQGFVVQIWQLVIQNLYYKEFVNGDLTKAVYSDDITIYSDGITTMDEQISEQFPLVLEGNAHKITPFYDPASCLNEGVCCTFEGQTYEHCGQYCGAWESTGGGPAINGLDSCCLTHDACLRSGHKKGKERCVCHDNFLDCAANKKGPGDTTIRNGIRAAKVKDGCYF